MIKVYTPSSPLSDYISCFWSLDTPRSGHTELVYPTGKMQLIFHYKKPFTDKSSSGAEYVQPQYALCGQKTSYSHITAAGDSGMIGAVFLPYAASALFPMPLCEVAGLTVSFTDIFREWKNHEGEFSGCTDDNARIMVIEKFLIPRINTNPSCHYYFARSCVNEIINGGGLFPPYNTMEKFSLSERSLQRIFRDHIGIPPKRYAEIVRLESSIALFSRGKTMTDVCHEAGYYDQPHFINSFKKFTGLTPVDFQNLM